MLKKIIIKYELICISGLAIGAGNSGFEIGGVDNPVIKDPLTNEPYIPGSSLKGKMRSLYEWEFNSEKLIENGGEVISDPNETAAKLFGIGASKVKDKKSEDSKDEKLKYRPTRLIVRDAFLKKESKAEIQQKLGEGIFTEIKTENKIYRLSSTAVPRHIERVPRGAIFEGSFIVTLYDGDEESEFLENGLFEAMRLLEENYLGAGGTRGSGKVKFQDIFKTIRTSKYYKGEEKEPEWEKITL
jgi:CRISPR-associated protein Csm3